ncbi:hypothetical protein D7D52_22955 [Nocardia yunnanensis]|uniref:DUF8017 domain-containing protein n=1 Tax=Nocardia yunnanensis TaxID=2382165 RepID=A0A386ZI28_9NOCA|nr:hypothetical protein [Nocardia yunnanensis]AYF76219.1 hypothetical protein D7D52_22955 [Nocardia yunnanensis]
MTDNHDHWSNPHGAQQPGGYPPQAPYQQPQPDGPAQGWGYPVAGQQGWAPQDGGQPVEYPPYQPQYQQPGYQDPGQPQYQPTQQYFTPQPGPEFPGQQQFPGYPQPVPPSRGPNRIWLLVGAIVLVLVLVGGGLAAYVMTRDGSDSSTTALPLTSASTAPTGKKSSPSATPSTAPKSGARTVVAPALGISYDVPSGWTIAAPTETTVQTGTDGTLFGYAKSSEGQDYCPGSAFRSLVSVAQVDGVTDLGLAATKAAKISIESGYDDPTGGKPGAPTAVTTTAGITGQQVEASGPWKPTLSGCTTNAYSVYTFAFTGPRNATLVLSVLADRGTTGELPADQAKALIASVRTS